jgi:hypothetical protein
MALIGLDFTFWKKNYAAVFCSKVMEEWRGPERETKMEGV